MNIEHINPDSLFAYDGFSQAVVVSNGKTAYIAGQTACDKDFNVRGKGSYSIQFREALRNVERAVVGCGGRVENVVKSTIYIKDLTPEVARAFGAAMADALGGRAFPAHAYSLIGVAGLSHPDILVEIQSTAVIDN